MRLSNHRRRQLAGHVDRDAAGSVAIPRSFGAARRRRCQFGFLARELSLWRGAGALWRAVYLPCPQSCSHRRDRAAQAQLRAWGHLPRCTLCRISSHRARTLGAVAPTCRGYLGLGAHRVRVRPECHDRPVSAIGVDIGTTALRSLRGWRHADEVEPLCVTLLGLVWSSLQGTPRPVDCRETT